MDLQLRLNQLLTQLMSIGNKTEQKKSIKEILIKGDNNTDGIGTSNDDEVLNDEETQENSILISFL